MSCIITLLIKMDNFKTKINRRLLNILALSTMLLYAAGLILQANAATSTSEMNVTANISATCTMSNTDLDFGEYDPFGANDLLAAATITTTCTSGTNVNVIMDGGLHSTRERRIVGKWIRYMDTRHMSNAGSDSKLQYELYTNENHTTVWNQSNFRDIDGSGASEDLTVYGKVFKNQQDAMAGSYTDTINIEVIY